MHRRLVYIYLLNVPSFQQNKTNVAFREIARLIARNSLRFNRASRMFNLSPYLIPCFACVSSDDSAYAFAQDRQSKVSKGAKIRNRYNQVPHLTQDTNRKVTNSQLDTTNESQQVSPFSASGHKAHIDRRAQRHSKHKTEKKHKRSTKEVPPWNGQ